MIVRLDADGAVVSEADDCSAVHVETALDAGALRTALAATGTGTTAAPDDPDADVVLDIAVLRSRARLVATAADWACRFDALLVGAGDRLTDDGLGLRVRVDRSA